MYIPIPLILSICLMYFGSYNMNHILKTQYNIDTYKTLSKDYKIAMIADLHYPTSTNKKDLNRLVNRIADEKPDFVMLCGDIIDENTDSQERIETFETLGKLSKLSQVFYVYGNHDTGKHSFYNRIPSNKLESLIENYGIHVLNDEQTLLNDEISIIGRKDYSLHQRRDIKSFETNTDTYNIVIDHQPKNLEDCSQSNIDLHLSGHTHAGQIFPLYYIYELLNINELNYGQKYINLMSAINTSGVSGWGFPIRTEHHSEFVIVNIL
ncbi:MAG: metallophosphoesterase [Holdemanella porci]|nr:metallophosphoesterase [Holdemanella porci]MCF7628122.1 metallophosphoesterase [Holdemanella sp. SCCA2]